VTLAGAVTNISATLYGAVAIGILGEGDFFGDVSLAGRSKHDASTTISAGSATRSGTSRRMSTRNNVRLGSSKTSLFLAQNCVVKGPTSDRNSVNEPPSATEDQLPSRFCCRGRLLPQATLASRRLSIAFHPITKATVVNNAPVSKYGAFICQRNSAPPNSGPPA
jgi:hypothetical protein